MLFSREKSVSLQVVRNHQIKHSYATINQIFWSDGARTALFSLYPAALSLAEVQITTRGDTRSPAPHNAASALILPRRSKHYLPTTRTPLKCPFLGAFLMVLLNRNASNRQVKRKCPSHYGRFPFNQNRIRRVSKYKVKCKI